MSSLLDSIRALIRQVMARVDYLALYPVEVVGQNDDDTVEIKTSHKRVASTSRIPIRGLPGVRVRVKTGARVLLGWEGGDPEIPYVALATADSLDEIILTAETRVTVVSPSVDLGDKGGASVARVGDLVSVAILPETPVVGQVTGQVTGVVTINGVPSPMVAVLSGGTLTGVLSLFSSTVGTIMSGTSRVKAADP